MIPEVFLREITAAFFQTQQFCKIISFFRKRVWGITLLFLNKGFPPEKEALFVKNFFNSSKLNAYAEYLHSDL